MYVDLYSGRRTVVIVVVVYTSMCVCVYLAV